MEIIYLDPLKHCFRHNEKGEWCLAIKYILLPVQSMQGICRSIFDVKGKSSLDLYLVASQYRYIVLEKL